MLSLRLFSANHLICIRALRAGTYPDDVLVAGQQLRRRLLQEKLLIIVCAALDLVVAVVGRLHRLVVYVVVVYVPVVYLWPLPLQVDLEGLIAGGVGYVGGGRLGSVGCDCGSVRVFALSVFPDWFDPNQIPNTIFFIMPHSTETPVT